MSKNNKKKTPPSFSNDMGSITPMLDNDDDIGEETTRRIGGGGAGISFAPAMAAPFEMPASHMAPYMQTQQAKAQTITAPKPTARRAAWRLRSVPSLPEYHPLERTAVFCPHQNTGTDVSMRISDVLRDRSIEASYEDDIAKVKCVTADGVDFRVYLYRGRGDYSHGIICEVQRRFGTSVTFHKDVQAILDAAVGKTPAPPPPTLKGSGMSALPVVSDTEDDYSPVSSSASSLNMVSKMLEGGYDSHYLALQTLSSLTDATKMSAGTARAIAKELLKADSVVGSKVFAYVNHKDDEDDMYKLRSMAWTVLANSVAAVKGKLDGLVREQLRPVLIDELMREKIESNPRCAQMNCRCIEYLLADDHNKAELAEALEVALEVGQARHKGLERQAQRCLDKINSSAGRGY